MRNNEDDGGEVWLLFLFVVDDNDNDLLDGEQSVKVSVDVQQTSKL